MQAVQESIQERIDKLAIAYVQSHFDVKTMSVIEFVQEVTKAQYVIADYLEEEKN